MTVQQQDYAHACHEHELARLDPQVEKHKARDALAGRHTQLAQCTRKSEPVQQSKPRDDGNVPTRDSRAIRSRCTGHCRRS